MVALRTKLLVGALGVGLAVVWTVRSGPRDVRVDPPHARLAAPAPPPEVDAAAQPDDARSHEFRPPSGLAPALTCEAARAIVAQARHQLAYSPDPVDPHDFAEAAADWLDPYGLWSVAPDTPLADAFDARATGLLADVEGRGSSCSAARALGRELALWVDEMRHLFDRAREHPDPASPGEDLEAARAGSIFEGATVTRPARELAGKLGSRVGILEQAVGPGGHAYAEAARARYFPPLDEDGWADVVLAAAVRAYVPSIDPHGAWAPLDEESSVYEVDLEARPPVRLWDKSERTALGLHIESGAEPPLANGDLLLSLGGVATGGLSFDQAEQLGYAMSEQRPPAQAVVLRAGEMRLVTTVLDASPSEARGSGQGTADDDELPVERVPYGDGEAIVVDIQDVRDDLGESLTRTLLRERQKNDRPIAGVALDLRGNGGGSTDGAIDALGIFLPGAPLFPMRRRDGSLETDRAPEPPAVDRWRGPVASLVDGDTASAAEMIAGALAAYRRGPTVGAATFGKGCAQEYLDDDAHAGVLRLTTLLYALPDGSPVQRVGLLPLLRVPFGAAEPDDREATLPHAPPLWRGPDMRDRSVLAHAEDGTWITAWPSHGGNVGPCKDPDVCRALRQLGAVSATARRTGAAKGR
jgi:carboxyl-terminal processing protease